MHVDRMPNTTHSCANNFLIAFFLFYSHSIPFFSFLRIASKAFASIFVYILQTAEINEILHFFLIKFLVWVCVFTQLFFSLSLFIPQLRERERARMRSTMTLCKNIICFLWKKLHNVTQNENERKNKKSSKKLKTYSLECILDSGFWSISSICIHKNNSFLLHYLG